MPDPVLHVDQLRLEAHNPADGSWFEIVHGVSFSMTPGETLGLIGESGAGKTSIALASMGYFRRGCRLRSGSVRLGGQDLVAAGPRALTAVWGNRTAYVAQSAAAAFNPTRRLLGQMAEGPVRHGLGSTRDIQKRLIDLAGEMDIRDPENLLNRYPWQVSGGQLQRAMVAMAIACEPQLIVFDEPTTALDVTTQVSVLHTIRKAINQSSAMALYITHDLAVIAQVADRVMVLRNGAEVECASTDQILNAPKEEYTRELLAVREFSGSQTQTVQTNQRLTVKRITASYGSGKKVLEDVSFDLAAGETVALVGESGSGKSTIGKVVVGLLEADDGSVALDGTELPGGLKTRTNDQVRTIQLIHQQPDMALNPTLTIEETIARPLRVFHGLTGNALKERVGELLKMVALPATVASRRPYSLSGGQKQRVCIARALAAEPKVIVCDEITSGLDPLIAKGILALLSQLQASTGVSLLFITHDIAIVKDFANRCVVLQRGRVVESGTIAEVFSEPWESYTELLDVATPKMRIGWLEHAASAISDLRVKLR